MNDRFRFRAWNPKAREWHIDPYLDDEGNLYDYFCDSGMDPIHSEDAIICQCSGLKDKNGELIYEGDILKFAGLNSKVEWIYEDLRFLQTITSKQDSSSYCISSEGVEIIGNIYENKELLK